MAILNRHGWVYLALVAAALLYLALVSDSGPDSDSAPPQVAENPRITELFGARQSGIVVEGAGRVERLLANDNRGSRHQRFILTIDADHTVLVSHNIDLAPDITGLQVGDPVEFRGQYEWNERGGVLHWTHHDPQGRRPGGWLRHAGKMYR